LLYNYFKDVVHFLAKKKRSERKESAGRSQARSVFREDENVPAVA